MSDTWIAVLIFPGFILFIAYMIDKETGAITKMWNKSMDIIRKYSK